MVVCGIGIALAREKGKERNRGNMKRQSKLIDVFMGIAFFWFLVTFLVGVGPSSSSGSITEIKIRNDGRFSVKAKGLDLSSISLKSRVNPVNFDLQFGGYRGNTEIQVDKNGPLPERQRQAAPVGPLFLLRQEFSGQDAMQ